MKKFIAALLVISGAYLIYDNEKKNGTIKSWFGNLFGSKSYNTNKVECTDFVQRTKFPLRSGSQEIPEVGYMQKALGVELTGVLGVTRDIPAAQEQWNVSEVSEKLYKIIEAKAKSMGTKTSTYCYNIVFSDIKEEVQKNG